MNELQFSCRIGGHIAVLAVFVIVLSAVLPVNAQTPLEGAYIAWSPDGNMLAVGRGISVTILETGSLQTLNTLTSQQDLGAEPAWSPDGSRLALPFGVDVEIWQQPWDPIHVVREEVYRYYEYEPTLAPSYGIWAVDWSSSGLATAVGGIVDVWQAGQHSHRIVASWWDLIPDLEWSVDGRIAIASLSNMAIILDPSIEDALNYFYSRPSSTSLPNGVLC